VWELMSEVSFDAVPRSSAPTPSTHPSRLRQTTILQLELGQRYERADMQLAELFYSSGIPFNVARSPYFKRAMAGVAAAGPGHNPLSHTTSFVDPSPTTAWPLYCTSFTCCRLLSSSSFTCTNKAR